MARNEDRRASAITSPRLHRRRNNHPRRSRRAPDLAVAVVNAYLVRELPYPDADWLYSVYYAQAPEYPPSGLSALDWSSLSDLIERPIAWDLDCSTC